MNAYSNLRERWHLASCKPSNMLQWLLHMEEHSFYLFLVKAVATMSIRSRNNVSTQDRKKSVAIWHLFALTTCMLNCSTTKPSGMMTVSSHMSHQCWSTSRPSYPCEFLLTRILPFHSLPHGIRLLPMTSGQRPTTDPWAMITLNHLSLWPSICTVVPCFANAIFTSRFCTWFL